MAYSMMSKLGDLLKDERCVAVLKKHLPEQMKDPRIAIGKGMTLKMISGMPAANISKEVLAAIDADLQAIK